jgi:phosphoserine/homoserine phosphotransferase
MRQLGYPTLFCHRLEVDGTGRITDYCLRQPNQKQESVMALKSLRFRVVAAGDSYNDTAMLAAADAGIFFRPPSTISQQFPQFPVTQTYSELKRQFCLAGGLIP